MRSPKFLQIGDVFRIEPGMKIYANIPERFVYANCRTSKHKINIDIFVGIVFKDESGLKFDTSRFVGDYVVLNAQMCEGGHIYPDGHRIDAIMLELDGSYNENRPKIHFYQSGYFTAIIQPEKIKVIRKMTRVLTFIPEIHK